jgi:RNA polymerase sigma-70 factor (ECF subfamily)
MDVDQELQMLDRALFDVNGRWVDEPQAWWETDSNPSETLQQKQTMQLLQACLEKLPEKTAHVFLMREYLGFESQEISHRTGLQMNHIRVIMMRARLALRTCLEFKMAGRPGLKE